MRRPPPSSTLFPYTTLFRSNLHGVFSRDRGQYELLREIQRLLFSLKTSADKLVLNQDVSRRRLKDSRQDTSDRKSTRLNSSHVKISYAVFCLKKKNLTI